MLSEEITNSFQQWERELEQDHNNYWNSLSKDDQLKAFCSVISRLYKAELVDRGSYRYALYNIFGFGPESYIQAQLSGFLTLHNAIWDGKSLSELINKLEQRVLESMPDRSEQVKQVFSKFRKDQWM